MKDDAFVRCQMNLWNCAAMLVIAASEVKDRAMEDCPFGRCQVGVRRELIEHIQKGVSLELAYSL